MRVFGAAAVFRPVAALLFSLWIAASPAPAPAIIPGRDAPVTVETICNPKPDAADILLPLPCDLTLALRAVDTPGGGTYFIGKYEISRYQWDAVMTGKCEALSTGPGALPLREVTPSAIRDFLRRYNDWLARERRARPAAFSRRARDAGEARLPSEAEWEFAARGGLAVPEAERMRDIPPEKLKEFGVISDPIPIHEPERIGSRLPNPLGLYDTVGNVKEMVAAASDSLIAFRGASFKHNPGEVDIGRHDEITAINERGAERTVSDLGLRLAFSTPGYKSALAARALHPEAAGAEPDAEPAGGGLNLPLALALCAVAFAAGGILAGLVVWFYQRRRLGMPVEEELALQENLTKWQRGYKQVRAALNKTLKEAAKREEVGLAAEQRASDTQSALAQTLQAAAASEEARRAAEARAEAAEQRAEKAVAHNETITRAAEEQIRQARAELEELRNRLADAERARQAAEERANAAGQADTAQEELERLRDEIEELKKSRNAAEEELAALREQRDEAEATHKQTAEQAEAVIARARAELEELRKISETAEQSRKQAEAALAQTQAELETARKTADAAEQARNEAVAELARQRETVKQEDTPVPMPQPPLFPISQSEPPKTYTNSIGMEFVLIPAGTFLMGSDEDDDGADDDEKPQHKVQISRPFLLGKYPVTQTQWREVIKRNPSYFKGPNRPKESVNWYDVQEFIRLLNERERHNRYRLPTEAEWEYACRAGATEPYCFGDDSSKLEEFAWYDDNSMNETHTVGLKRPNAWGLYDMHGNVWEWVQDLYGEYDSGSEMDPQGPFVGKDRVLRGGSWGNTAWGCRSANRFKSEPDARGYNYGFRLVLDVT